MGNKTILHKDPIQYYKDLTSEAGPEQKELMKKVSLSITLLQCEANMTYFFTASLAEGTMTKTIGTSEQCIAKSKKLKFPNSYLVEYFFEKNQPFSLLFTRTSSSGDTSQFSLATSLGSIVGSKKNTLLKKLSANLPETVKVKAVELKDSSEYVSIKLKVDKSMINFNDHHCYFYFVISSKTPLYQSESLPSSGVFKAKTIPADLFKGGQIKVDFFNYKSALVKSYQYDLDSFVGSNAASMPVRFHKKVTLNVLNSSSKRKSETFIDYLKAGVKLNLSIGIDYTSSNLKPQDPKSLHYLDSNHPNDYQRAIKACGDIVAYYDFDQLFPVYGFGAKLPNAAEVSMCFHINSQPDPNIYTINQVLDVYQQSLPFLELLGPTYFAPIINQCIATIKSQNNKLNYHILMILTDGIINDMDKTVDALVEASFLPLSVIIIGIGSADFSNMGTLDADDEPLVSSQNVQAVRDLVQFVPFSKFSHDGAKLAEEVLAEIPKQLTEYYSMNNLSASSLNN